VAHNYDAAITGGRVIDPETWLNEIRNVGIKGDKNADFNSAAGSCRVADSFRKAVPKKER